MPVKEETRFLPAVADAVAGLFPMVEGRSMAVSAVTIKKDNLPTLPLVMVCFVKGAGRSQAPSTIGEVLLEDTFVIEFWLEPERYKRADKSETPFWGYYDYEWIRSTLLTFFASWCGPNGERVDYRRLDVEADTFSVNLTFEFIAIRRWRPAVDLSGMVIIGKPIDFNLCVAQTPARCLEEAT